MSRIATHIVFVLPLVLVGLPVSWRRQTPERPTCPCCGQACAR